MSSIVSLSASVNSVSTRSVRRESISNSTFRQCKSAARSLRSPFPSATHAVIEPCWCPPVNPGDASPGHTDAIASGGPVGEDRRRTRGRRGVPLRFLLLL